MAKPAVSRCCLPGSLGLNLSSVVLDDPPFADFRVRLPLLSDLPENFHTQLRPLDESRLTFGQGLLQGAPGVQAKLRT